MCIPTRISRRDFFRSTLAHAAGAALAGSILNQPCLAARSGPASKVPDLGIGANLNGKRGFPSDNAWNTDISSSAVDPNSDNLIASIGLTRSLHADFRTVYGREPWGIPFIVVTGKQKKVAVNFDYADESDPGPYPIPANAPIEGGASSTGDRHVLVIDRDDWLLYEMYAAYPTVQGNWKAGSGAIFNLNTNDLRPAGWTSADAAGLPIFPGLVRYEEGGLNKRLTHALRFT